MTRFDPGAVGGGLLLAAAILTCFPGSAAAASAAREKAALTMLSFVGGPGPLLPSRQPPPPEPLTPDAFMVVDAWRSAGVRVDRSQADYQRLEQACAVARTPDSSQPGPDPQPGDFLLYDTSRVDPTTPAVHPRRVALFVSPVEVVYWDDADHLVERAMAVRLVPSHQPIEGESSLVAHSSTDEVCRLPPGAWPGGDRTSAGWRYALADPGYVAEQHQWAAAHPRDADTSLLHPLAVAVTSVVALGSTALSLAVGGLQSAAGWLLGHLGVPGSLVLGILGLLGTEFDGRRLHRFLTGMLLLPAMVVDPRLGRVAAGLLRGQSPRDLHARREGSLTRLMLGGAELAVDTLTGIEDSRHVRVGMVLFAVATDLLVFGKLAVLGRLGVSGARLIGPIALRALPPGARLRVAAGAQRGLALVRPGGPLLRRAALAAGRRSVRLLDAAGDTGDLVAVRPDTVLRALGSLGGARLQAGRRALVVRRGLPNPGDAVREGLRAQRRVAASPLDLRLERAAGVRAIARAGGDAVSLIWRGRSATRDLVGHLGRYTAFADAALRAGGRAWGVRSLHSGWAPLARTFPGPAARLAQAATDHAVPAALRGARLVHLNSEAHSAVQLLSGQPLPAASAPLAPVALPLHVAAEVRRAAALRAQLGAPPG
ncbi:MAG: hypothetical protein NVSMB29_06630 [Candidatus Dormibacteria bacterium]